MESQQTKTKPTLVEMAEKAMQNMKVRIEVLKEHKANINRLIQTAQGSNKPMFLLRNVETEEALLRKTRTELNLWIQAQRSGKRYVDEEYCEVFQASVEAESLTRAQRSDDCGEDIVEFPLATRQIIWPEYQELFDQEEIREDFRADVDCYLNCESSHTPIVYAETEDWADALWDYEEIPLEERFDILVDATQRKMCGEWSCFGGDCWFNGTVIPNV